MFLAVGTLPLLGEEAPYEEPIGSSDLDHWAFEPLVRPPVPGVEDDRWCRTPIDRFILARLEENGMRPMPQTDRLTLLRRVTFDLTGLPPTIDDINTFLADESPDAFGQLVDRLLESPAYGERWAQHWLDLARFAETDGYEHDRVRPQAWRYRDWVIDALNADMPYDRFLSLQLAGDELSPQDAGSQIATGFLLCGPDMPDINLQQERRHTFLNGMASTVSEVVLSLRMGCAQCHDHKTDPISQYDFYRLRAFFDSIDLFQDHPLSDSQELEARVVCESAKAKPGSYLWIRGDFRRQGPPIEAAFPRVVEASLKAGPEAQHLSPDSPQRVALVEWLTRKDHPLTARVMVNRIWQHHLGVGLVGSPSDFGLMGQWPTHPALLDWLATELTRSNWSLKTIHRLIVTSAVYQTASHPDRKTEEGVSANESSWSQLRDEDPDNEWLGRMRRRRLEGEAIRDALLLVSGQLNREAYGPGVRPPLATEVTSTLLRNQWPVTPDPGEHTRRSIYLFVRRNLRYPLFDVFDKPDTNLSCPERSQTTVAPQALHLFNSDFAWQCAEGFAARVAAAGESPDRRIESCYLLAFGRPPTADEQASAQEFLDRSDPQSALVDLCLALLNTNEFIYID